MFEMGLQIFLFIFFKGDEIFCSEGSATLSTANITGYYSNYLNNRFDADLFKADDCSDPKVDHGDCQH